MNNVNLGEQHHPEKLDADAVCAQCSTVNAEGTLLCKVCGNNLRDQRSRRMQADQVMDLEHTGYKRRAWVSALLFVLATAVIVSTLFNQELIVNWMIGVTEETSTQELLWIGEYDDYFQPLTQRLSQAAITAESAAAALQDGPIAADISGIYALFDGETFLGSAIFQVDGEEAYFVAYLNNGDEIRGVARPEAGRFIAIPDYTAMNLEGRVYPITGVAIPQGDGMAECMGDDGSQRINCMAFRMPDGS